MRRRRFIPLVALTVAMALMGQDAGAAEFSPTISFKLSDAAAGANPSLEIKVAQERDEEELQSVQLELPAGFTLPVDADIPNNNRLGGGTINIDVGPRCRGTGPLSAPANNVPVNIVERDRNSGETADGAIAVWVVDIQGVTNIPLVVKGSTADGYILKGNITANQDTCPPFAFNATINKTSASGVPIIKNPANGGSYLFAAEFTGVQQSVARITQNVDITGPGGGTAATGKLTAAEKKKCKKKKSAKARRACLKKQRAD